jgi:hypothetical protein
MDRASIYTVNSKGPSGRGKGLASSHGSGSFSDRQVSKAPKSATLTLVKAGRAKTSSTRKLSKPPKR